MPFASHYSAERTSQALGRVQSTHTEPWRKEHLHHIKVAIEAITSKEVGLVIYKVNQRPRDSSKSQYSSATKEARSSMNLLHLLFPLGLNKRHQPSGEITATRAPTFKCL